MFTDAAFPFTGPKDNAENLLNHYGKLHRFVDFMAELVKEGKDRLIPIEDFSEQVFQKTAEVKELEKWPEFEEFAVKAYLFFNDVQLVRRPKPSFLPKSTIELTAAAIEATR